MYTFRRRATLQQENHWRSLRFGQQIARVSSECTLANNRAKASLQAASTDCSTQKEAAPRR